MRCFIVKNEIEYKNITYNIVDKKRFTHIN